jgi:hypothetical protein
MPPAVALSTLEEQRAQVLASVASWSAARLGYRPSPNAWSAVEVLDHIARVEREILTVAQRGLVAPHRRGVIDRVRVELLEWLFRSDRRVRVPMSVPEVLPARDTDFDTVCRVWELARLDLTRFLAPLSPDQLVPGVFRHPVAGWMNVPQVLRFFWVHTHHHRYQLARLHGSSMGE